MRSVLRSCLLAFAACATAVGTVQNSNYFAANAGLSKSVAEVAQPTATAFNRNGSAIASIDKSGALVVTDFAGSVQATVPAHKGGKGAVAFSPSGEMLATWGSDQAVILWETAGPKQVKTIATTGGKPGALAFSGDGTKIACGGDDGTIRVFDTNSGNQLSSTKAHGKGGVLALAFEPSGTTVVSVGADRHMKTVDVAAGTVLKDKLLPGKIQFDRRPEDEYMQARSAACTPDGSLFAVGGYSWYRQINGPPVEYEYIFLYDRSGRKLVKIAPQSSLNMSLCVSITPDGKLVGSSAPDGKMRIWDVEHRELAVEQLKLGNVKATAATKLGNNYLFAVAGNNLGLVGVSPTEDVPPPVKGEEDKGVSDGLIIEFATPSERSPIVSSPNLEITALLSGLQSAPKWTIDVAGHANPPAELVPSDNRELVLAAAPSKAGSVGPAAAVKVSPGTVKVSQNVTLSEGPNRIRVTVQDGAKKVTAVKTVCYIPDGESVEKSKVYSDSFAVIVGVNKYTGKSGKNIPALSAAVADATALADVLKAQYGFKDVVVLTDANATRDKVMKALNRLTDANVVKPNDRVVVFWSGHGQTVTAPEGGQVGFLLPTDAQIDFSNMDNIRPYRETCVPMDELARLARDIPAKHVLFLVDACFSGLATTGGNAYPPNTFGLVHQAYFDAKQIITASSKFEPAKEKNGHGYFTKAVLDALSDPTSDENGDGYLTASELYRFIMPKVQTMNSSQTPRLAKFSLGIGETLFFK